MSLIRAPRTHATHQRKLNATLVHHGTSGQPQPLAPAARLALEPRFGHSFENIRVHTDERAAESAMMLNADAYTVGSNIVFAHEQYEPESLPGQELLAHELTHSVQQGGLSGNRRLPAELEVSEPRGSSESEADLASGAVMAGQAARIGSSATDVIARREDDERQASFPDPEISEMPPEFAPRSDPNAPTSFPGDVPPEPDPMADVPEHDPLGAAAGWGLKKGFFGLMGKLAGVPGGILKGILGMESDETPAQREARKRQENAE